MRVNIYEDNDNEGYHLFKMDDCLEANPIRHFENNIIKSFTNFRLTTIKMMPSYNLCSPEVRLSITNRHKVLAKEEAKEHIHGVLETEPNKSLVQLLAENKKKAQQKLLKGVILETNSIMILAAYAWKNLRMPYSRLTVEYHAKELAGKVYPRMFFKDEDGAFKFHGVTDLTDAQMQVALDKRHRVICDFIGNEERWYCFFRTLSGIKGLEAPHIDFPHMHYISSAWGISLDEVKSNLSSYRYSLKAETIPFRSEEH